MKEPGLIEVGGPDSCTLPGAPFPSLARRAATSR